MVPCVFAWFQVLTGRVIDSTIFGMAQKLAQEAGVAVVETAQGGRTLRAYGTFPHPNIFGGYLVIGLAIVTWLAVSARSKFCVFLCAASCCVLSATLMITFSRSAWIACVLWFAVLFFVTLLARCALSRKLLFVAFAALTAFVLIAIFFRAQVFSRFDTSLRVESLSVEERTSQYDEFGKVFLSSPILGTGPGAYTFALALQKPGMPVWEYQPIHNTPLLILAELGIVGLLFFVHWVYRIDKLAHSNWREHGHEFALALGSVLLVIALFDHYLWSLWPGLALSALSLAIMMKISYND
jgi:O-antigen ligase